MIDVRMSARVWSFLSIFCGGCLVACGGASRPADAPEAPTTNVQVAAPAASVSAPAAATGSEAGAGVTSASKPSPSSTTSSGSGAPSNVEEKLAVGRTAPRHRSKVLDGDPRPSKLAPGNYMCRVDAMYKLRPCTVARDERGFTWLEMPDGLLGLKGVVYDDGGALVFDGTTAEERPFGCFSCQERCTTDPSSCGCTELMPDASRECLAQPIVARLTKQGSSWVGNVKYKTYFNHYEGDGAARHVTGWDPKDNTFLVEVAPAPPEKKASQKPAR